MKKTTLHPKGSISVNQDGQIVFTIEFPENDVVSIETIVTVIDRKSSLAVADAIRSIQAGVPVVSGVSSQRPRPGDSLH